MALVVNGRDVIGSFGWISILAFGALHRGSVAGLAFSAARGRTALRAAPNFGASASKHAVG